MIMAVRYVGKQTATSLYILSTDIYRMGFSSFNSMLSRKKIAFRPNLNTSDALQHLLDYATEVLESKKQCAAWFMDLAKPFDCMSLEILLKKHDNYGIRNSAQPNTLLLCKAYTTCKNQLRTSLIVIGVEAPQGSNLIPLMFMMYINVLVSVPSM